MTDIPRDRFGRPLIKQPNGKAVPYTRATTIADTLDDRYALELWKCRQTALGLAVRPDLVAMIGAKRDDKETLNRVVQDAMDASASSAPANLGTALHGFVEQMNRGETPWGVPRELQPDLDAYANAMTEWEVLRAEEMVVLDDKWIAGTPDMVLRSRKTGQVRIGDLKTGKSAVEYGQCSIAAQLAIYSRGVIYHHDTGDREPLAVDQAQGLVIHLPAGTGRCTLWDVDLNRGWEAVEVALWVRDWRKARNLFTPAAVVVMGEDDTGGEAAVDPVVERIAAAGSVDVLHALYREVYATGVDMSGLVPLFAARKAQLLAGAAA